MTLDYPDALTGGLRRTTDNTRGILEKTRGDLTLALRQEALVRGAATRPSVRVGGRAETHADTIVELSLRSRGVVAEHASLSRTRPPVRIRSGPLVCVVFGFC